MIKHIKTIALVIISIGLSSITFAENYSCDDLQVSIDNQTSYIVHVYFSNNSKREVNADDFLVAPHHVSNLPTVINRDSYGVYTDINFFLTEKLTNPASEAEWPLLNNVLNIRKYLTTDSSQIEIIRNYFKDSWEIKTIVAGFSNCLLGELNVSNKDLVICANLDGHYRYGFRNKYIMSEESKLIQPTRLPSIELEIELLNKGYCDPDINKAKPGIVKITLREKPASVR